MFHHKYGNSIQPVANSSYRNHRPICLYSIHVDIKSGEVHV
ncbi:RNHCP domain-containing protein [Spartinivicinus ruber]